MLSPAWEQEIHLMVEVNPNTQTMLEIFMMSKISPCNIERCLDWGPFLLLPHEEAQKICPEISDNKLSQACQAYLLIPTHDKAADTEWLPPALKRLNAVSHTLKAIAMPPHGMTSISIQNLLQYPKLPPPNNPYNINPVLKIHTLQQTPDKHTNNKNKKKTPSLDSQVSALYPRHSSTKNSMT
jgi:hypothetical protein